MKKICSFFILFMLLMFSVGCQDRKQESFLTKGFNITSISINDELEGIDIKFEYLKELDIDELSQQLNEEKLKVGLLIKYQEVLNIDELTIEDNQYLIEIDSNNQDNYQYIFKEDLKDNLNKYISIRLFYKYDDNEIKYRYSDTFYSDSLYNLVFKEDYKPEVKKYDIVYELDGGTNPSDAPYQYEEGKGAILPTPKKLGYKFLGWTLSNVSNDYVLEISKSQFGDVIVYANWEAIMYTITYELDGGTNPNNAPTQYEEGKGITLLTPTKSGFNFLGWTLSRDSNDYMFKISNSQIGDVVVYANWEAIQEDKPVVEIFTITYVLNGGINLSDAPYQYEKGKGATLPIPTKEGYEFLGWSKVADSIDYITEVSSIETGDVKVYANWKAKIYSITYVLNGGINPNGASYQYEKGKSVVLPIPEKSGYKFLGWSNSPNSKIYIKIISASDIGNITLYANWEKSTLSDNIIGSFKKEIDLISCQLDYKNYSVTCLEANYRAQILTPLDYEVIRILIKINLFSKLSEDFELKVNDLTISQEDYIVEGNEILVTLKDNKVKELDVTIDYVKQQVSCENSLFDINLIVEGFNCQILCELEENYLYHFDFIFKINGKEINENQYEIIEQSLTYSFIDNTVREISIKLDTTNYVVSSESQQCSVVIEKPLDYIYINTIITLNDGWVFSEDFKLIVNGVEIKKGNYEIDHQSNIIKYVIDDPNWTKPY